MNYLAREALGVPLSIQSRDEALHDGLVTALAAWGVVLVIALPTEGLALLFMETFRTKLLSTESAEEVFWMPCLVQGTHHSLEEEEGRKEREEGRSVGRREIVNQCRRN